MNKNAIEIDLSYAKSALFVRQTIARTFGIPLDQEFSWDILRALICRPDNPFLPHSITLRGWPQASGRLPEEAQELMALLHLLKTQHNIKLLITLHD